MSAIRSPLLPSKQCVAHALPALLLAALLAMAPSISAETSKLWGQQGELWDPSGPLPDFSFAGYQRGEKPIPNRPVELSVKDYGAEGDGETDDTQAFQKAIAENPGKVIGIPEGRYLITDILMIMSSGTVLRGAGSDKTVFVCPTPLETIKPNPLQNHRAKTAYSWSGGIVWIMGYSFGRDKLCAVQAGAKRGAKNIEVDDASGLMVGQDVILTLTDDAEKSLLNYVFAGDPGDISLLTKAAEYRQICRIEKIEGNSLVLDRPLRYDIRENWRPELRKLDPRITEAGVEGIGFEFPASPYEGHFSESGFNAVAIQQAVHCWMRDIRVINGDSGVFLSGTRFCTVQGITLEAERKTDGDPANTGHHGITVIGYDNLITDFEIRTQFVHDITVQQSIGNVISNGKGDDLCLDHHREGSYENLFTNLDVGKGSRVFQSGGSSGKGKHSGAGETFWGILSKEYLEWPEDFGPERVNWVGLKTREGKSEEAEGRWIEKISPSNLEPKNLHAAQLSHRMNPGGSKESRKTGSAEVLTWKNAEGKEIKARFIRLEGDWVILEMAGRKTVRYPLAKLSPESQKLAKSLAGQ